jgi:uncharacterized cupin superfamily protein
MSTSPTPGLKPVRRVVTGTDPHRRSRVLWDGPAPNVNPRAVSAGAGMTDVWVSDRCPAIVTGERDDGRLPFSFEPPEHGGHLRIVPSQGRPPGYDPLRDPAAAAIHEPRQRPGGTWDRGGQNAYSSPVHRSATIDYGIVLEGERVLRLDDGERTMRPGDMVVQLANWHGWTNPRAGSSMAFVMMGAMPDTPRGLLDASAPPPTLPDGARPVRRIVTVDDEQGRSRAIADGPCPDVHLDPARPGFSAARIWVTDGTPAHMEKTPTLDLCLVLEGEVTLVLDTAEIALQAGDTVVQRATNHAWSNRSEGPAVIAVSSHDARA